MHEAALHIWETPSLPRLECTVLCLHLMYIYLPPMPRREKKCEVFLRKAGVMIKVKMILEVVI